MLLLMALPSASRQSAGVSESTICRSCARGMKAFLMSLVVSWLMAQERPGAGGDVSYYLVTELRHMDPA